MLSGLSDINEKEPTLQPANWFSKGLSLLFVLTILVIIGAIIYVMTDPSAGEKFTEFYILGPGGKAENYPKDITLGQSAPVLLGIVNREKQPATYSFYMFVDNVMNYSKEAIDLQNDEKWEGAVPVKSQTAGENQKVEFYLYKDNAATPYLKLHLFVNVK